MTNWNAALFNAINSRNLRSVQEAIHSGAQVNILDQNNYTPLARAVKTFNSKIVQELLNAGADPNTGNPNDPNYDAYLPLYLALTTSQTEIVQMLLDVGANLVIDSPRNDTLWASAFCEDDQYKIDVLIRLHIPLTAKGLSYISDANMLDRLIASGTNINMVDSQGLTALHHATSNFLEQSATLLLKSGADPNVADNQGNTPLHYASNVDIIDTLLKSGAGIDAVNLNFQTPLEYILTKPRLSDTVFLLTIDLVDNGADLSRIDVNMPNLNGRRLLHFAKKPETVDRLLDNGAILDIKDNKNKTPLESLVSNPVVIQRYTYGSQGDIYIATAIRMLERGADPGPEDSIIRKSIAGINNDRLNEALNSNLRARGIGRTE